MTIAFGGPSTVEKQPIYSSLGIRSYNICTEHNTWLVLHVL